MWVIFGQREKSERVPNGKVVERRCDACGEVAMFYERHVTRSVQLYFFDVFHYGAHRAMACGACGALYATDELGAGDATATEQGESVAQTLGSAMRRAGDALRESASQWLGRGEGGLQRSDRRAREERPTQGVSGPEAEEPQYDPDAELNQRFEDLERKARERKS